MLGLAAVMVAVGLVSYFRNQGVCTFDDVKRERQKVINITLLAFTIAILGYLFFNYVVLEILGIAVGLPWEDDAFWN